MSKEQKRDELTEIIIKANEDWLREFGRMHLHLEHKAEYIAAEVHNAGYRKQSEGKWLHPLRDETWKPGLFGRCSNCNYNETGHTKKMSKFCPNCGAKMKGSAE